MNVACSTCLDSLTLESSISATPCGHVFHTDCLTKWIESGQNICSHCRAEFQKKNIVKLFFSQNELGLEQNEILDDISEENQKLLQQANEAKSRELEASQKVEKIQSENIELKKLIKTHRNVELNVKRNFNVEKQDMLEQIEELKKVVSRLNDDFRSLFTSNYRTKSEYCNLQSDYKTLKTTHNQLKLAQTELKGTYL